jgi:hypothetical protein
MIYLYEIISSIFPIISLPNKIEHSSNFKILTLFLKMNKISIQICKLNLKSSIRIKMSIYYII